MDIGPYVALFALVIGTPFMAYKKQWVLAGYFLLNAIAIVCGTLLGSAALANALTWASLVLLAVGVYQLLKQSRATQSAS